MIWEAIVIYAIELLTMYQAQIQMLYAAHRTKRNSQQREKFVSPEFKELIIDPFLLRLENKDIEPGFKDPRNCMVFWGRPPTHILELADKIQEKLQACAPSKYQFTIFAKDGRELVSLGSHVSTDGPHQNREVMLRSSQTFESLVVKV